MKNTNKGIVQMVVCAVLWSIGGIFIKLVDMNPFAIAGYRSLVAAISVLVFLLFKRERIFVNANIIKSAVFLSATFFGFVAANKLTTAANAIVLQFTAPVFLLIGSSVFYKQKLVKSDIAVVALTLLGIALCFFDKLDAGGLLGNIIAVGAGMTMAGMYLSVGNSAPDERMNGILAGHALTALIGVGWALISGAGMKLEYAGYLAILGVFQLGIPYILYALAAASCTPLALSLIAALEPLLNPVWVAIFDGEKPGALSLIGGIIVILSITVWCWYSSRAAKSRDSRAKGEI